MRKTILSFFIVLQTVIILNAQTPGKLSVTVTTSEAGGKYKPRNVIAIWIENEQGNFIKTLLVYANKRKTHLNNWQASTAAVGSEYNKVDAISGATKSSHTTRDCSWDGTDHTGSIVADGKYYVRMELTDKNSTGNNSSFLFTKGTNPDEQNPSNESSFSSVSINWTPATITEITFEVDMKAIADLYDGGAVWLVFGARDSFFVMTDTNDDNIYTYKKPLTIGSDLEYSFSYQTGANLDTDFVEETVPAECDNVDGYRELQVPNSNLTLPAILFSSCSVTPPTTSSISIPITSGNDDAEEDSSDGSVDLSSSDLEIIFDHSPQYVGMIFRNVQIQPNASIKDAYIQFTCDVPTSVDVPDIYIYGAAKTNIEAINETAYYISSQPKTTAMVNWSPAPQVNSGNASEAERTADISSIIEEIVALDGWVAGSNILIVIAGNDSQTEDINREVNSADANNGPVLNVTIDLLTPDNATLSALTIDNGTLSPAFDPAIYSYDVELPAGTTSTTIAATPSNENNTISGAGVIDVTSGNGATTIFVSTEDGNNTLTYTINYTILTSVFTLVKDKVNIYYNAGNDFLQIRNSIDVEMLQIFMYIQIQ